jgi:hypothetical protein
MAKAPHRLLSPEEIHKITDHWNPIPSRIDGLSPKVIELRVFQFVAEAQIRQDNDWIRDHKSALGEDGTKRYYMIPESEVSSG